MLARLVADMMTEYELASDLSIVPANKIEKVLV